MNHSPKKKIWAGALAALLALFAAVVVVATPAKAIGVTGGAVNSANALVTALGGQATAKDNVVTLNNDVELSGYLNFSSLSAPLTLDLAGHTILAPVSGSYAGIAMYVTNSTLTITGNGTVTSTANSKYAVINMNGGGNLTIENGTVSSANGPAISDIGGKQDTVAIKGGTIKSGLAVSAIADNQVADGKGGSAATGCLTVKVSGGTITGGGGAGCGAVQLMQKSKLEMTGGTISTTGGTGDTGSGIALFQNASVLITNGSVSGGGEPGMGFGISTNASGTSDSKNWEGNNNITITGGTITGGTAGIYLPGTASSKTTDEKDDEDVLSLSGDAQVTGAVGVVAIGSTVNVGDNATITATGTAPVKAGDSGWNFPPAAVVEANVGGSYPAATTAGMVSITGGSLVAADGQPSVAYTTSSYTAETPLPADSSDVVNITGGNFSEPVQNDYLNKTVNWMVTNETHDPEAPFSYYVSKNTANNFVALYGGTMITLNAADIVSCGFASTAAEAAEQINAAITASGSAATPEKATALNANTMWAIVKGAPNTKLAVSFYAPVASGSSITSSTALKSIVVTTDDSGVATTVASFPFSEVTAASLTAGTYTVVGTVGSTKVTTYVAPATDAQTGSIALASITYNVGEGAKWSATPAGGIATPENMLTVFYNANTTANVTDVVPKNNEAPDFFVSWYQNTTAGQAGATANWVAVASGSEIALGTTGITLYPGYINSPVTSVASAFTNKTAVVGTPTPATFTVTLGEIKNGKAPITVANAGTNGPTGLSLTAEQVQDELIDMISAALSSETIPNTDPAQTYIQKNIVSQITGGTSYAVDAVAGTPTVKVGDDGTTTIVTNLTITPKTAIAKSPSTLYMNAYVPGFPNPTGSASISLSSPMVVNIAPTDDAGSVEQVVSDSVYTLTAVPADGYTFVNWTNANGQVVSTNPVLNNAQQFFTADAGGKLSGVLTANFSGSPAPAEGTVDVTRLYNPYLNGAHLLSASETEVANLKAAGWTVEGTAFTEYTSASANGGQVVPVYRLYNPYNGDHFYTASNAEAETMKAGGWQREGTAWYAPVNSNVGVTRLYNPYMTENAGLGNHLWSANYSEVSPLLGVGWKDEGRAWFAVSAPGV